MRKMWFGLLLLALAAGVAAGPKEDIKEDMQAGRWLAADAKLVKVLQEHPNNAQAHYWMAQVKEREGLPLLAREHLQKARELAPDLAFAGSRDAVTEMERRLTPPPVKNPPGVGFQPHSATPAAKEAPHESGHGLFFWLLVLGLPLLAVVFWIRRTAGQTGQGDERARLQAELRDLANELRDAEKAIDGRAELNAEQKMALSDRLSQAQGDLARESATLPSRTDFAATRMLIVRLRDIAAEARGEEKPSLRAERQAAEMRAAQPYSPQYAPGVQPQGPSTGAAIAAGVGGLVAGAALGSLLGGAGAAHAHGRERSDYEPIDGGSFDSAATPGALDFGNDNGSSDDWNVGGTDLGGDSGGGDW